jgi:hypothetical protein
MDDLIELAQRLDFAADCGDMGRKPDHSSVTRRSANALRQAADALTTLQRQLAELQAENFMLAAGACINPGQHALIGDEHGNPVCTAYEALQAAERAHSEALAQLAERDAELAAVREERDGARKALDYLLGDPGMPAGVLDRVRFQMQRYKRPEALASQEPRHEQP